MAKYKMQIKLQDETMQDLDLDAKSLDGKDSTYYLNYDNFTNKPYIPQSTEDLINDSGFITSIPTDDILLIIENNSETTNTMEFSTLELGTSESYDTESDSQVATTKVVQTIVNLALGDIEALLEAI